MFRNENELLDALFNRLNDNKMSAPMPSPLSKDELNEIETYRDADGIIDLTGVTSRNDLKRLVELVDRKNHIEMLENKTTFQDEISNLVNELLPLLGVDKASVKVATPSGKASVEVEQGKEPKFTYDINKNDVSKFTYTIMPNNKDVSINNEKPSSFKNDDECSLASCKGCPDFNECYTTLDSDHIVSKPQDTTPIPELEPIPSCIDNPQTVFVTAVGGDYNPLFCNAVTYICENEHFPEANVYCEYEDLDGEPDVYVLVPNAFGKIYTTAAKIYSDKAANGAEVYVMDVDTFELMEITNPFNLFDYAMTEAQEAMFD